MPCHEDSSESSCAIENWCVCQWAFASYIGKAGGCDAIQDIQCDAINMQALVAYKSNPDKYGQALSCLSERCGVDMSTIYTSSAMMYGGGSTTTSSYANEVGSGTTGESTPLIVGLVAAIVSVVGMLAYIIHRKNKVNRVNVGKGDDMTASMSLS